MGEYYVAMTHLYRGKLEVFDEFIENPVITEDFIAELKYLNGYYEQVKDIYYGTRWGEFTDVTVSEYLDMEYYYNDGDGWEPPALREFEYMSAWSPGQRCADYCDGEWTTDFSKRYAEGLFELSDNYYYWVVWSDNIVTPEGQDDESPDEYRQYRVENPNKDAYLLVDGLETGYQLIHIQPVTAEETAE